MAHEARQQMPADDAARPRAHELGGGAEILLAQRQELRAHGAREAGPVEQAQDQGDAEIDEQRAPAHRQDADSASQSGISGNERRISIRRWVMLSTQPP